MHLYEKIDFEIPVGTYKGVEVKLIDNEYTLLVDNVRWMGYKSDVEIHEIREYISHHELGYGDVIGTGLGLGLREQILLSKPEVTSLTILERSQDLVDFHLTYSKWVNDPRVKLIVTDAGNFHGSCDTLLLDHYAHQSVIAILNNVANINKNIDCKILWFWPLEMLILKHSNKLNIDFIHGYKDLKSKLKFDKLPDITSEQIDTFCEVYKHRPLTIPFDLPIR